MSYLFNTLKRYDRSERSGSRAPGPRQLIKAAHDQDLPVFCSSLAFDCWCMQACSSLCCSCSQDEEKTK